MGEGWGDWFATMFLQTRETTRAAQFPMGLYAARRGIRPFPYSADLTGNPQTFGFMNMGPPYNAVHTIGSLWCQILFQVYWDMREAHGFDGDWWYGTGGNNVLLQDVTDGFKLQPCNPNFVQARDAISKPIVRTTKVAMSAPCGVVLLSVVWALAPLFVPPTLLLNPSMFLPSAVKSWAQTVLSVFIGLF